MRARKWVQIHMAKTTFFLTLQSSSHYPFNSSRKKAKNECKRFSALFPPHSLCLSSSLRFATPMITCKYTGADMCWAYLNTFTEAFFFFLYFIQFNVWKKVHMACMRFLVKSSSSHITQKSRRRCRVAKLIPFLSSSWCCCIIILLVAVFFPSAAPHWRLRRFQFDSVIYNFLFFFFHHLKRLTEVI